jgi:hypothetical protein
MRAHLCSSYSSRSFRRQTSTSTTTELDVPELHNGPSTGARKREPLVNSNKQRREPVEIRILVRVCSGGGKLPLAVVRAQLADTKEMASAGWSRPKPNQTLANGEGNY